MIELIFMLYEKYLLFINKYLLLFVSSLIIKTMNNKTLLQIMNVIFWIIFIGLCIEAGAGLFALIVHLVKDVQEASQLSGVDLNSSFTAERYGYLFIDSFQIIITSIKAYISYLVIEIFKQFNLEKPFSERLTKLITKISREALVAGILALIAASYSKYLLKLGVEAPSNWGAAEILFFAGVIYIIALVFKRGSELQAENDLTV